MGHNPNAGADLTGLIPIANPIIYWLSSHKMTIKEII